MINQLKLYDPLFPKVRLGSTDDGGYVLPIQSLGRSVALFTYGVEQNICFEKHYVDVTGRNVHCYDHTIEGIGIGEKYSNNIFYHKEGLSSFKTDVTNNFLNHYKDLGIQGRVLFKADVEGCEFDYILNTDISELAKITTGLLFEFHYLEEYCNVNKIFWECLRRLNDYFYLCHVHGNNWGTNFVYDEIQEPYIRQYSIPENLELTFINKDLVEYEKRDHGTYPSEYLDRPNKPSKGDLDLTFLKMIS